MRIPHVRLLSALLSAIFLTAATAEAATIVQTYNANISFTEYAPMGQSFTAEDAHVMAGFSLSEANPSLANLPLTLILYSGAGFAGTELARRDFTPTPGISNQYHDVDFTALTLTLGAVYSLEIRGLNDRWVLDINGHTYQGVYNPQFPDYVGGHMFLRGNEYPTHDIRFRVYAPTSAVPEPATVSLAALGAGVTALRRRRARA